MSDLPPVAFLWIGGPLTWLERLCLKSFANKGHPAVLYAYGEVGELPRGVELRDGREILGDDAFVRHERTGSFALFSDAFRYHLMVKRPGEIWMDTDMLCWRAIEAPPPVVVGYEAPRKLNGAILRLPPDSDALGALIEFTRDEYPIPPFARPEHAAELRAAHEAGEPVHVSRLPWGVWGPHAITHFLNESGEAKFAEPEPVYYPLPFPERKHLFSAPNKVTAHMTPETRTVHLWARRTKRYAAGLHGGRAPETSFLGWAAAKHGVSFDEEIPL